MGVYDVTTGITLRREVPEELRVLAHRQAHGISARLGAWGWVVRHEIDAKVLWCVVAPLR